MPDKIQQWKEEIDEITRNFREEFGTLTTDELNRKPNGGTWSIAENMEHLIAVNESYSPIIEQLKTGNYKVPFLAKSSFFVKFMGNTLLKSVSPDRKKKMKTFPVWEPKAGSAHPDVLNTFIRHQAALKRLIEEGREFVQRETVIASPANRNIVYTLERAFEVIIAHEKRHFNQASEVMDAIFTNQYKYDI
jgi:hypothetical protein